MISYGMLVSVAVRCVANCYTPFSFTFTLLSTLSFNIFVADLAQVFFVSNGDDDYMDTATCSICFILISYKISFSTVIWLSKTLPACC